MATNSSSSSSSSGSADRFIRLLARRNRTYIDGRTEGYRLLLEVEEANGVDPGIFVYKRSAPPISSQPDIDDFAKVAAPFDIDAYPLDIPDVGGTYFRKTSVELVFRNLDLLEQTMLDIEVDIQTLVRTYNQFDDLDAEATTHELTASS